MTILVSLPSRPPSPASRSPPVRARSVSSRSTCSSAADSSASAWPRFSVTSVIWCLLRLGGYTVKFTVPPRQAACRSAAASPGQPAAPPPSARRPEPPRPPECCWRHAAERGRHSQEAPVAKSDLDNPSSSRSLARPAGNPYKPSSITHRDYEPEPPPAPFALKPMALGADRAEMLRFACQFTEFGGWVFQDAADLVCAMRWTDRALDYALELGDQRVIAYTLMRKAMIATESGDPARGLGIANSALEHKDALTPRLRAVILRQRSFSHAALGEVIASARDSDEAVIEAVAGE